MAAPMDVLKFVKVDPHKNEENGMEKKLGLLCLPNFK